MSLLGAIAHLLACLGIMGVVSGLLVGVRTAAALSRVLRHILYGISNLDPLTYAAAIGLFIATVAAATLLPAMRALRVDPLRALRHE